MGVLAGRRPGARGSRSLRPRSHCTASKRSGATSSKQGGRSAQTRCLCACSGAPPTPAAAARRRCAVLWRSPAVGCHAPALLFAGAARVALPRLQVSTFTRSTAQLQFRCTHNHAGALALQATASHKPEEQGKRRRWRHWAAVFFGCMLPHDPQSCGCTFVNVVRALQLTNPPHTAQCTHATAHLSMWHARVRPSSSMPFSWSTAALASEGVANATVPQPLLRPSPPIAMSA